MVVVKLERKNIQEMFKDKNQHLLRTRRRPACICSEEKCQFPLAGNTGCAHYAAHWYYISPDTYFSKFLKMLSVFETYLSSIYYMLGVKRWPRPSACFPWASKSSWQQTQLPRLGHPLVETFTQATYQTPLCLSDTIRSATSHTSTFHSADSLHIPYDPWPQETSQHQI